MAETAIGGENVRFQPTLWTTILQARDAGGDAARSAMGRLIERYWKPLYFFVRRRGCDIERAKDTTQAFFERVMEKDFLQGVAPEKGRFRNWLLAAMSHFMSDERERERALKRGGGNVLALDVDAAERQLEAATDAPERLFDRAWATEVLDRSLGRLRGEWPAREFDPLVRHLSGGAPSYTETATTLGLAEHDIKNRLTRMRQRLREILRDEIAPSVEDAGQIDEEMAALFSALA